MTVNYKEQEVILVSVLSHSLSWFVAYSSVSNLQSEIIQCLTSEEQKFMNNDWKTLCIWGVQSCPYDGLKAVFEVTIKDYFGGRLSRSNIYSSLNL